MRDFIYHWRPITLVELPEQSGGRIPRRIAPLTHPPHVAIYRQHDPDRYAQGAREMYQCAIHGDDKIESCEQLGRVQECFSRCVLVLQAEKIELLG